MILIRFLLVSENDLSDEQRQGIEHLEKRCFGDVDPVEVEECFYAESFARILAYKGDKLVGHLLLHKRDIEFDGREVVVGGAVGACVVEVMRGRGIATKMMKKGFEVLRTYDCDVACLNADLVNRRIAFELYKRLGFELMEREISFEDTHGRTRYDTGTMFIPLRSKELFNHIMNNEKTFHYGKGYW